MEAERAEKMLFIYAKQGVVTVLDADAARALSAALKSEGWRHTLTIDPILYLEHLANEPEALAGRIAEMRGLAKPA